MKDTYFPSEKLVTKKWYIIDAKNQKLGRLATQISKILIGKHKRIFTPFLNLGDNVVVLNASHIVVTGNKEEQKNYRNHSGQPGGMRIETFKKLKERCPEKILQHAIKGMLPKNSLGRDIYTNLKIYRNDFHPHQAQNPELLKL